MKLYLLPAMSTNVIFLPAVAKDILCGRTYFCLFPVRSKKFNLVPVCARDIVFGAGEIIFGAREGYGNLIWQP